MFGGIEAGGTKFVCAIGADPDTIVAQTTFATTTPAHTLDQAIAFFQGACPRMAPGRRGYRLVRPG